MLFKAIYTTSKKEICEALVNEAARW